MNGLIGVRFFIMFAQLLVVLLIPATMVMDSKTQIENIAVAGIYPTATGYATAQTLVLAFVALAALMLLG